MDRRERRVAQIVRDFMEAYVLSSRIRDRLRSGGVDFAWIENLVGDSDESALYRLKEECHSLFRLDGARPRSELQAEELFDLAVGALFHEGMKFRESYYLTTTYGPRLERMMGEGSASGPLAEAFRRVFEAGRRRMLESEVEVSELFRETRDQLLIVLRQMPPDGAVARALVADAGRSEAVFGLPLGSLLAELCGSEQEGFKLALQSLIENGHFIQAASLLADDQISPGEFSQAARPFTAAMVRYYAGDLREALEALQRWVSEGARGEPAWRSRARHILESMARSPEVTDPELERTIGQLSAELG